VPFGFVTTSQLKRYREELRADYAGALADQKKLYEKLELEWDNMFDQFRRLYAKLSKRAKTDDVESTETNDQPEVGSPVPPPSSALLRQRRAMRGW
jgi:predicted aminopeptidase